MGWRVVEVLSTRERGTYEAFHADLRQEQYILRLQEVRTKGAGRVETTTVYDIVMSAFP